MRKIAKTGVRIRSDNFVMWIIAAGVLVGTFIALAI